MLPHMVPAIDWPKDRPACDARKLPPGFQGVFRTGCLARSNRNAFGDTGTLLIGLGTSQRDDQASIADLYVTNLETHEFTASKCASNADQQNRFIAQPRHIIGQRRYHAQQQSRR